MKIKLFLNDRLVEYRLPEEVFGSFSFSIPGEEINLINVDAKDNSWVMYQTDDVHIIVNNQIVPEVLLEDNHFYLLQNQEQKYLIFVEKIQIPGFSIYQYSPDINIQLGNVDTSTILYHTSYLNGIMISIRNIENQLCLEFTGNTYLYVNEKIIPTNKYLIQHGDKIDILGLSLRFLENMVFISNSVKSSLSIKGSSNLKVLEFLPEQKIEDREIKDIDLYSKDDYFSKSPRLRRTIEAREIDLSQPPQESDNNEVPLLLVIGPMLTMGVMSLTTLLSTLSRITNKQTTFQESWPQIVTSGVMMISMIVWPLVTQAYNRFMKKKRKKQIIDKYTKYLEEKKQQLEQEATLEKQILYENLIPVTECLKIIENKSINFWDKRNDQKDFLVLRVGLGNEKLNVKINYPKEGFSIDESELKNKADKLISDFLYIENVPVGYSFYDNKVTAIMGNKLKRNVFVHNLIVQLITFYSYEDIKIVMFTNKEREHEWDYIRYLNHNFTNDRLFRFFAIDQDSIKSVSEYIQMQFHLRLNSSNDHKSRMFSPHYFIIIDDYDKVKHQDFIKLITELDDNLGFSLVILEDKLSKLPSKCNNFITIGEKESGILKNSFESQEQINFQNELYQVSDMMKYVRILSNIPIEFQDGFKQLPDAVTFMEMEKVGKVEQLNILNRWNTNDSTASLRAEVGLDEQGELMFLDLHEKYHGPHGLIAGMTGSGKSEFIITYILSMAINYSPDDVAFILIDYKGGGLAYAFENKAQNLILPHLAGTITNLDKAEMDRTLVSIDSEIKRRQKIFNEARDALGQSTIDIYKYQRFYKEGKIAEAIPHLFIICDEFAELKAQQPEFMDNLISVARIGRSLGIHLILATQKPSGVVNEQIWSNTKFRVCLKVQDEQDSREMLKRPEAASLRQAGRYYLQVGYDELFALGQSAWCGAKYYPSESIIRQVDKSVNFIDESGNFIKSIQASNSIKIEAKGEQLSAVMQNIIDASKKVNKKTRKLWLDNIPEVILEDTIANKYQIKHLKSEVLAVIGEYDAPQKQEQGVVTYQYLRDCNMLIYGNDGAEKENLLNVIIYSTCKYHSASEVNFYMIDYGSESLRKYNGLPQIGGIVFNGDEEGYHNLFKLLSEEIKVRKRLFADYGGDYSNYVKNTNQMIPLKIVILNNYDSIYESNSNIYDILPEVVRDSYRYGVIFIITANSINSVHGKVSQNFQTIITFKLKDSSDYSAAFGVRSKLIPRDILGRGLLKLEDSVYEFQTASICPLEKEENDIIQNFVMEQKNKASVKAKRIPTLPDFIRLGDIEDEIHSLKDVPIGIEKSELDICEMDFLANIGNIITSNRLANTEKFIRSLLEVIRRIRNINLIVIDPLKLLLLDKNIYPNYYHDQLEEVLDRIIQYMKQLSETKQEIEGVIVIYGFAKFITKLKDTNQAQLDVFFKTLKNYEKISLIVVDDASKIKNFSFDPWFSSTFNTNDGIWIGRGVSDQNLLHLSSVSKEMTKDYKNDMGYCVIEGVASLCRFIDFVTKEDSDE